LLVSRGSSGTVRGMLSAVVALGLLSVAYFVVALIDGCALSASETVFGKHVWAGLHMGMLGACGILFVVYLVEAHVLKVRARARRVRD